MEREIEQCHPLYTVTLSTFLPRSPTAVSFDASFDHFFFQQLCVVRMIFLRQVAKPLAFLCLKAAFVVLLSGKKERVF